MKKLLAFLLVAMMIFSLAACGNNDDNPSGSENNPGTSQSGGDNQGGDNTTSGKEWPTNLITAWSGSGKIIYVKDNSASGGAYKNYWVVYIDTATMDEFTAYIAELKSAGFTYGQIDGEVEPSDGYDEYEYNYAWNGHTSDGCEINVKRYHEPNEGLDGDFKTFEYSVQISLWIRADATIDQSGENNDDNGNQGGTAGTNNGEWPKNEWTSHVPEADGTVLKIEENMDTGMGKAYVLYMDWTDEDALAYQQKLVDAGKIESVGALINDVYYLLFTEPSTGRKVMINEIGETENDYVIVLYK